MFLKLDIALASHLSQRQKDIATATLQAQREGMTIDFREFDNEIFDLAKDRMTTILKGLAKDVDVPRDQRGRLAVTRICRDSPR